MSTNENLNYGLQVNNNNSSSSSSSNRPSTSRSRSTKKKINYSRSSRKNIRNSLYTNNRTIIRPYVLKFEYISIILYYYLLNQDKFVFDINEEDTIKNKFSQICKFIMEITNFYMILEEGKSNNYNKIRNQYMTNKNNNKNKKSDVFSPLNMNISEIENKLIDIIKNTKIFVNKEKDYEYNLLDDINKTNYIIIIQRYVAELEKLQKALHTGGYNYKLELPIIKANLGLILYALNVFEKIDCFEFKPKGKTLKNILTDLFYGIIDLKSTLKI